MKPLKGDQQLRSVSLSYSVVLQALKPKSSPRRRRGLDASTDRGLTERSGEVFSLDILSHRMRVMTMLRQLKKQLRLRAWNSAPQRNYLSNRFRRMDLRQREKLVADPAEFLCQRLPGELRLLVKRNKPHRASATSYFSRRQQHRNCQRAWLCRLLLGGRSPWDHCV